MKSLCLSILLTLACGYNPTRKNSAVDSPDGGGAQAAITDGSPVVENPPDVDAAIPATPSPDTSQVITGSGGKAGSSGGGGVTTGGIAGVTGAGGAVTQDAGPTPDTALAPATCPAPVAPANGKVDPKSLNVGGQANYTCDSGYGRPTPESRICQADGTWSGANPTCAPVDCGKLEDPKNGKVKAPTTTYKSEATYSCDSNYGLSVATKRTCQADGTWSGTSPTCQCEQKMCNGACVDLKTDNANCGDCGKVCSTVSPSLPQCIPTGCLVLLARGKSVGGFALDANYAYWSDINASSMNRVSIQGGASTVLADSLVYPSSPVVDANKVYWVTQTDIQAVSIAGGEPTTLVKEAFSPSRLAANATHLYYINNYGIARVPLAGGDALTFVAPAGGIAKAFVLDATNIYWLFESTTGKSTAKIMKQPLAGGDATTLVTATKIDSMAVDATSVYWTVPEDSDNKGSISKVPLAGGQPTVLATGLDGPSETVVDGSYVYWIGDFGGQVLRVPVTGGTPTLLASNRWLASKLKLDATSVYWVENRNDTSTTTTAVMKLTLR